MKKLLFLTLVFASMHAYAQNLHVTHVCNVSDQELIEMMQGNLPDLAVEFSAQTQLPLTFFLKGDLLHLVEADGKWGVLEVKQTFFVRCVNKELLFSANLKDWKPIVEFITGTASVSLTVQEGQPSLLFGVEANKR